MYSLLMHVLYEKDMDKNILHHVETYVIHIPSLVC
jgi:hypothetical protein